MDKQAFIAGAISAGYGTDLCEGWDWMRENLSALDYIFYTPEYRAQGGMSYKCMPLLLTGKEDEQEARILNTAWYLNNEREDIRKKNEYAEQMVVDGWLPLTTELLQRAVDAGKKIVIAGTIMSLSQDWLTARVEKTLKPVKRSDGSFFLLPPRAKRRGYWPHQFENAFCKIV